MTRNDLATALDRYGGDLSRWPPELAREAEALVAGDAEAAAALSAAQRLDGLLAEVVAPEAADAAVSGRVVAGKRAGRDEAELRPTRRLAAWASAVAALALMIGFAAGAVMPPDDSSDTIAALIFAGDEPDIGGDLL